MSIFRFKKWYFDVITERGDILYAYFIIYRLAGLGRAILSAHLISDDGRHVRASLTTASPSAKNGDRMDIGGHILEKTGNGVRLFLDLPGLRVDLRYASEGSWRPNVKGELLRKGHRVLGWEVLQYRASVRGTLGVGPQTMAVRGTGYQDLVWTDIPPWRLPTRELLWGRAHFPSATVVFNQLTTVDSAVLQNILVKSDGHPAVISGPEGKDGGRPRWIDDFEFQLTDGDGPRTTRLLHPAFSLSLTEKTALEESPVSTPDRIRWTPFRRALDRLSGRPEERKVVSGARLEMGGREERGLALHERVAWNWGPRA